jgi:tight adherence protein B
MTPIVALVAVLGVGTGIGLLLIARGIAGPDPRYDGTARLPRVRVVSRWLAGRRHGDGRRLAACTAVGVLVGVVTRWPVAAVLAGCAAWVLSATVGPDRDHQRRLARIEAIATWTESLRDTLAAAAGLEQAIHATAPLAPEPIRGEVTRLAGRLRSGDRLPDALRVLSVELDDSTADLVITALVMAAERHARHVGELLTSLAAAARNQASLRMRVAAGRARVRTSTRVIVTVTATMAAGLTVLNRGYLAPYDSPLGQFVLLIVGLLFAAGFGWLMRIARMTEPPRVLAGINTPQRTGVEP